MTGARPLDARRVFRAARRVGRARQAEFLERVCGPNRALRAEVELLLAVDPGPDAPPWPNRFATRLRDARAWWRPAGHGRGSR